MKVLLVHSGSTENEAKQAREWLEAEGCQILIFDLNASAASTKQKSLILLIAECDAVVFLIDGQLSIDDVQAAALGAHAKGKEIIGVHLGPKISIDALEKYASASTPFKQNLLVSAVCRHNPVWMDDDGEPRDDQEMDHHKCKKQKAKVGDAAA